MIRADTDGRFLGSDIAEDGATIAGCSAKGATEPHEGGVEGSNPSRSTIIDGWQYRGEPLTVNDPDWVAEATEPLTSSFYMTAHGAATLGLTVRTARGEQRAKFKDWIVRVGNEIYLLSPEAYAALSSTHGTER